jgi:hypothetical protein
MILILVEMIAALSHPGMSLTAAIPGLVVSARR